MRFILLFLLTSICMFAEIAKVSAVVGNAKIQRNAKTIIVKIGTLVEEKDIVQTSKNSKVQLIFKDNTVVTLGKNSALNINEYLYDTKNPKKSKTDFNFFKGAFKTITGKIGKINKEKFKLRTKNSTIGIRGTVILANQTTVLCLSGEISVTAQNNQVIVPQNQATTVQEDGELSTPTEYTQETLQELSNSLEPQDDASSNDDSTADSNESSENENSDDSNDEEKSNDNEKSEESKSEEESESNSEENSSEQNSQEQQEEKSSDSNSQEQSQEQESQQSSSSDEQSQEQSSSSSNNSSEQDSFSSNDDAIDSDDDNSLASNDTQSVDNNEDTSSVGSSGDSSLSSDDNLSTNSLSNDDVSTNVASKTSTITQTAQDAADDNNEVDTEQTTISFNMRGNTLGAYVESNTTTASTNNFRHQDNTTSGGKVGIFRATRVDNKISFDENFSRIFTDSSKTNVSKELDETFTSLGTPTSGGYTGYSNITNNVSAISFSYTSTGSVSLSGNYTIYADNLGEVFVFYYDGSAFDVQGGTAEYNELVVFGKNGLINQADSSKVYIYKDFISMRVGKDSNGNFIESKLDTQETGFEYFNANLKSMTHISKDVHSQGAEEFIVGNNEKIKVFRNKYNFNYNSANSNPLNLSSYNSGSTEASIEVLGTDLQALTYNLETTDNTKTYSTNTTVSTTSQNSGVSFLQKDKIQNAKTSGEIELKGFINAEAYGNNSANTHLRKSNSDLTLNINRANGKITGDASVGTTSGSTANGVTMKFDGEISNNTSYYINDDIFGVMADTGNSNYKVGSTEYDLDDNTGYLIAIPDGAFEDGVFKLFDSDDNPLTSDDDSSWGYWTGKFSDDDDEVFISPFATWVAGIETPTSIVDDALNASSNTRYTFEGAVIGTVLNGNNGNLETIITDGSKTNTIKMNFDLGGGSNSLTDGTVGFSTTNTTWDMTIQGSSVTNTGFSGTLSGSGTGSIVGKFYGSDSIKSVGGTIGANQTDAATDVSHKAQGVFKAIKK